MKSERFTVTHPTSKRLSHFPKARARPPAGGWCAADGGREPRSVHAPGARGLIPTCPVGFCRRPLLQFRRCKGRKRQTRLGLAWFSRKREAKRVDFSPWGQHLIHPIWPWAWASRTSPRTRSRGDAGRSTSVKKWLQETPVKRPGRCFGCSGAPSSEDRGIHTCDFFRVFKLRQDKEVFFISKIVICQFFQIGITAGRSNTDSPNSFSSSLRCNRAVVSGCQRMARFLISLVNKFTF